ncbi:MAG: metal-sensing transcriptional repressor [Ruminococcaceae bacterium]|nr:metal-sensing transcriptional repressor [Oscillospiraceae bacterium]
MEDKMTCCQPEGCRRKHREPEEYEALLKRLNRIEGQVRGVRGMVEKEAYCTDILTQVSAIQSALNAFSRELLGAHIRTCVADGVRRGEVELIDELVHTVEKMMK